MKTVSRVFLGATVAILAFAMVACASLGVPTPKTFNERLAAGYTSVTTVRQLGTTLVTAGKITPDDAQNIQAQANTARSGLDIAKTLSATLPVAAEDKLTATLVILVELQKYLDMKQKEKR
jgi:hypothetical protein